MAPSALVRGGRSISSAMPLPSDLRLVLLLVALLPSAGARFWQSTTDSTSDGDLDPAQCRPGQLMTGFYCTGSYCDNIYLQCANARVNLVEPTGPCPSCQTASFSDGSPSGANCTDGRLVSGMSCTGSYCDNVRLICSKPESTLTWVGAPKWSAWFSEEDASSPFETPPDTFILGAQCNDDYCNNMRFLMVRAITAAGSAFEELSVGEVRNIAAQGSSPLDLMPRAAFVVGTTDAQAVVVGSKVPQDNTAFGNSTWQWFPDPFSQSADYRRFTFSTQLPSGSSFALEAPRDPSTSPPPFSIVALGSANNERLTCVNVDQRVQVNSTTAVRASLYCLPYSVFPPRTVLISYPTGRVDVTALIAADPRRNPCDSTGISWRQCWYTGTASTVQSRLLTQNLVGNLSFNSEIYRTVGLTLKNQMMAQLNKVGYPIVRQDIDMFAKAAYKACPDCNNREEPTRTPIGWNFETVHTMREEDARQAQVKACQRNRYTGVGGVQTYTGVDLTETLRITVNAEVRNQELMSTLVDAYAQMVAASAICFRKYPRRIAYGKQFFVTYPTGTPPAEMVCDIQIPNQVSLSIWELGGEQATMSVTARMTDCNEGLAPKDAGCPEWTKILGGVLGMMKAIPTVGTVAAGASGVLTLACSLV